MSLCLVACRYLEDRRWVLEHLSEFEERCKECVRENEKERAKRLL